MPSYSEKKNSAGYNRRRKDLNKAIKIFGLRSPRSQAADLARKATIAPTIEVYIKYPNRFDWRHVDVPGADKKTRKATANHLCEAAQKKPVEVVMRRKPPEIEFISEEPVVQRFRVQKKPKLENEPTQEETKTLTPEVSAAAAEQKPKKGRKLPASSEIYILAAEMFMEDQFRRGLEPTAPEEQELRENGFFEKARCQLMRGIDTIVDPQVEQYVNELRAELEPQSFTIIPISAEEAAAAAEAATEGY